jgi:hypothetical protein
LFGSTLGLTKKPQKVNFTPLTELVDRIFLGNTDFLVSPECPQPGRGCQLDQSNPVIKKIKVQTMDEKKSPEANAAATSSKRKRQRKRQSTVTAIYCAT